MNRRPDWNQALDFAIEMGNELGLPVLFYEGLTCSYPYASDRFHTFILEGVAETEKRLKARGIGYIFYLRQRKSDANDVLYRLAERAAAVVTDDYPAFVTPRHNASVAPKLDVAHGEARAGHIKRWPTPRDLRAGHTKRWPTPLNVAFYAVDASCIVPMAS